ncbi:MAG: beta-galactosidase [Candidatus Omnitrophica bacterium]|nr:beta-galactosidase [Candidatus Omnitrophota bacterium]
MKIWTGSLVVLLVLTGPLQCQAGAVRVGTTFSQVQCEYLELDWKKIYRKTLNMGFDVVRLGAYWNRIEKKEGEFDFRELDRQMELAEECGQKIMLVVGMKAPRWPEYFLPVWLWEKVHVRNGSDISADPNVRERVPIFIEKVITRYSGSNNIIAWQVENEPFNRSGPNEWWISEEFLKKEMELVRDLDPLKRPIVLNVLSFPNKLLGFLSRLMYKKNPILATIDLAQIPAVNVYPVIGHKIWGAGICFRSEPTERISYLKGLVSYAEKRNKVLWVTELQAEPWEPGHLVYKGERAITCLPGSFMGTFEELRSAEIDAIFLWGVEYWFFRKEQYGDDSWVDVACDILEKERPDRPDARGILI